MLAACFGRMLCWTHALDLGGAKSQQPSYAPLRFVKDNKIVVLGLISSKLPELESISSLAGRIDEAAKVVPLENLCVSPQCGFSSTVHGNEITHDVQWAKLQLAVDTAQEVWGD